MTERALPFGRPHVWGWLFAAPFVAAFGVFASNGRAGAAASAGGAALAWVASASVRKPHRHRVANVAVVGAVLTLLTTWLSSTVVAYAVAGDQPLEASWVTIWLIAAPNIGGLLALFRSVQTRAETSATLHELSQLRVSALSAPLIEAGVRVREAATLEEIVGGLTRLLRLAVGLRLLPREVDRASVWALDRANQEWFICASTRLAHIGASFRQPVIDTPKPGAGIVSNLATLAPSPRTSDLRAGDVLLIRSDVNEHPWFRPNPSESRRSEGMASILIRVRGEVCGALCLTSASEVIAVDGTEAREVVDILEAWAQTFSDALELLYRLASSGADDVEPQ